MRPRSNLLLVALIVPLVLAACSSGRAWDASTFDEADRFVDQLEQEGIQVIKRGTTSSTYFNRPGLDVRVNTTDVLQIFEYENEAEAQRDVQMIQDNITQPPHFYQQGPLVVVHWGEDGRVTDALEELLDAGY